MNFIKLDGLEGKAVWILPERVVAVLARGNGSTRLVLDGGVLLDVKESPQRALKLLWDFSPERVGTAVSTPQ